MLSDQPTFQCNRVDVELKDESKVMVHMLQQTQHLAKKTPERFAYCIYELIRSLEKS